MYALDLVAQLPNLQSFRAEFDFEINHQLIMERFPPWLGLDPETKERYSTARAERSKSTGENAIRRYTKIRSNMS